MSKGIGKSERASQDRVIQLFQTELGYTYLGDWEKEVRTQPIERNVLMDYLLREGYSADQSHKAIDKLVKAASNLSNGLYETNKEVYHLLRYGVTVREELGQPKETVWLIDWKDLGEQSICRSRRSYGAREAYQTSRCRYLCQWNCARRALSSSGVKLVVEQGIRQNLDNQKEEFIPKFFTALCSWYWQGMTPREFVMVPFKTPEKYFLTWKEESDKDFEYVLDKHIYQLCEKTRLLELVHDFIVFDKGVKKLCRP